MNKKINSIPVPVLALIGYLLTVLLIVLGLKYFTHLAAPFFFSLVIAYLFNPVVNFMERKTRMSRGIAAALVLVILVFMVVFLLINLFPYIMDQLKIAADKFPQTLMQFAEKMDALNSYLTRNFSKYIGTIDLNSKIGGMLTALLTDMSGLLENIFSSLFGLLLALLYLVFIPLISFYFLKDAKTIHDSFFSLIPLHFKKAVIHRVEQMDTILSSFIRGQAIVVVILAILYSIGLSIISLPFAILIGVMAGIGDIIPYFGTVMGFLISLIVGLGHYDSVEKLLLVCLVFFIIKGAENWFFYPKIVGKKVGLHFVWVLVAIVTFGRLFGFWGLLVAIPASAGIKIHIQDVVKYYKNSQFFKRNNYDHTTEFETNDDYDEA